MEGQWQRHCCAERQVNAFVCMRLHITSDVVLLGVSGAIGHGGDGGGCSGGGDDVYDTAAAECLVLNCDGAVQAT